MPLIITGPEEELFASGPMATSILAVLWPPKPLNLKYPLLQTSQPPGSVYSESMQPILSEIGQFHRAIKP